MNKNITGPTTWASLTADQHRERIVEGNVNDALARLRAANREVYAAVEALRDLDTTVLGGPGVGARTRLMNTLRQFEQVEAVLEAVDS